MAWVVGELSVGPPLGVDPVGKMRLRIQNKQTNKHVPSIKKSQHYIARYHYKISTFSEIATSALGIIVFTTLI